jgi:type VI secretion system secreted protein Hcp
MKLKGIAYLFVATLIISISTLGYSDTSSAASELFVNIDGINGSSTAQGHVNWIEATSFSMGVTNTRDTLTEGSVSKPSFQPLTITKPYDVASPQIAYVCAKGSIIPSVILEIEKTGAAGQPYVFVHVQLSNVVLSSVSSTLAEGSGLSLVEVLNLTYSKICWTYDSQDTSSGALTPHTACWNLEPPVLSK